MYIFMVLGTVRQLGAPSYSFLNSFPAEDVLTEITGAVHRVGSECCVNMEEVKGVDSTVVQEGGTGELVKRIPKRYQCTNKCRGILSRVL